MWIRDSIPLRIKPGDLSEGSWAVGRLMILKIHLCALGTLTPAEKFSPRAQKKEKKNLLAVNHQKLTSKEIIFYLP